MAFAVNKTAHEFKREALEALLIKRFFYCPAFEIYGGTSRSTGVPCEFESREMN